MSPAVDGDVAYFGWRGGVRGPGPGGYRLSETSGHNRAELERRLGHANDRYLRLYTNPPDDIAASYIEDI